MSQQAYAVPAAPMPGLNRWGVASRAVAAVAGGYALVALAAAVLALYLPGVHSQAALSGGMASFLVCTFAVLWSAGARTALRVWVGLGVPAAVLGLLLVLHDAGGAM